MASKRGLFGTNGIRGKVNDDLNINFVIRSALSIGSFFGKNEKVVVGSDTRKSSEMVKFAIFSSLISQGHDVFDAGIVPTPALQLYSKMHGKFGIMVTASHNPPEYNGIKVIGKDGTEIDERDENEIEEIFYSENFRKENFASLGNYMMVNDVNMNYIESVVEKVNREIIKESKISIALDCSNGSSIFTSSEILKILGVKFTTLNCNRDGLFISHNPEPKEENLKDLSYLTKNKFSFGAAHDGDADRVAFVDENGSFVYGDKILALFAKEIVSKKKGYIVLPVSATMAVEEIAKMYGSKVIYTRVGAPIVARKMIEMGALFGGEDNGGYIFSDHQYCRDGAMALARLIEIVAKYKRSLSEIIKDLPEYYQKKSSVNVKKEKIPYIMENLKGELKGKNFIDMDGIKVIEGESWILIRPSGTEPLIRIYAESKDRENLESIFNEYMKKINSLLDEL